MYKVSENNLVVQHNKIIEAKYKLSVGEQRLIKIITSMIEPSDDDFKTYRLSVSDLAGLLDIKRKDFYDAVKDITEKLISNVLVIEYVTGTLQVAWLSSALYHKGDGVVDLKFAPELKPFLLQLKSNFTAYELRNVIRLRKTHSIRMYELLKQYEKIGKRKFSLEELRNILMIDDSEYKTFNGFKKRVLFSSQEEVNEKTDIYFEFTEERKNQKCVAIEFTIRSQSGSGVAKVIKDDYTKKSEFSEAQQGLIDELIIRQWLFQDEAEKFVLEHGEDKVRTAIDYIINNYEKRNKEVTSPSGLLFRAVSDGYQTRPTVKERNETKRKTKLEADKKANQKDEEQRVKEREENKKIWEGFLLMPEEEKNQMIDLVLKSKGEIVRNDYKKNGLKSLIMKGNIITHIKESLKA